jgi:hypothetical protein
MFSAVGMGKMKVVSSGENGGEIEMPHAYVDEGWLKKWGKRGNFIIINWKRKKNLRRI